uniref:Uncharacterized protein n=1 Tax=Rhizophora mucronata TaxID=61149 RepID=A0A2P2LIF2_RHIMU
MLKNSTYYKRGSSFSLVWKELGMPTSVSISSCYVIV